MNQALNAGGASADTAISRRSARQTGAAKRQAARAARIGGV
jgi:hypothetical protein